MNSKASGDHTEEPHHSFAWPEKSLTAPNFRFYPWIAASSASSEMNNHTMHSSNRHNDSTTFERNDSTYLDPWPMSSVPNIFSYGGLHHSNDGSFTSQCVENNSRTCDPMERFFHDSQDSPFYSVMEPDPYCDDEHWFHTHHNHSRTWPGAPLWNSHNRIGSPDETIQSSASGSRYYPESNTDQPNFHESDLPWFPSADTWQINGPSFESSHSFGPECFDTDFGSGIALREIQSYPDQDLDEPATAKEVPKMNAEPEENIVFEYTRSSHSPSYDTTESTDDIEEDPEIEGVHASPVYDGDSDYKPPGHKTTRRQGNLRKAAHRRHTIPGSSKVTKNGSSRNHRSSQSQSSQLPTSPKKAAYQQSSKAAEQDDSRPFSCPLTPYGCKANFTSKNEWKRHVTSQHICIGFWRCDMCQDVSKGPNDFNRKDLFIQHVRRMHSGSRATPVSPKARRNMSKSSNKSKARTATASGYMCDEDLERKMDQIKNRCWVQIRKPPTELSCAFCDAVFSGLGCTEEWLEHAGKHIGGKAMLPSTNTPADEQGKEVNTDPNVWEKDILLKKWLVDAGLIERSGPHVSSHTLVDKNVVNEAVHMRSLNQTS